jgi:hypothetical protein
MEYQIVHQHLEHILSLANYIFRRKHLKEKDKLNANELQTIVLTWLKFNEHEKNVKRRSQVAEEGLEKRLHSITPWLPIV